MGTSKLSGKYDRKCRGGGGVTCNGIASHLIELAVILVDKHKHRLCLFPPPTFLLLQYYLTLKIS